MKTTFTAVAFALTLGLSGLTHAAGFNDRSVVPETALTPSARQDLSHLPTVHGFQQQSVHALAAPRARTDRADRADRADRTSVVASAHCELSSRFGFQQQQAYASC
jgi:hypothetical protein